jgi:hypothetical protein
MIGGISMGKTLEELMEAVKNFVSMGKNLF